MAAPSVSGGPTLVNAWSTTPSSPDLHSAATLGTASPYSLNYSGNASRIQTGAAGSTWWGGKLTHSAFDGSTVLGRVAIVHIQMSAYSMVLGFESCANGGGLLTFRSTTGNDASWVIYGSDHIPIALEYISIMVDPGATAQATSTTGTFNPASVAETEIHFKGVSSSRVMVISGEYYVDPYLVINGVTGDRGNFDVIYDDIIGDYLRICPRQADGQILTYFSWGVGDGSTLTWFQESDKAFAFPQQGNASDKRLQAYFRDNQIGFAVDGSGSDTIIFTTCSWIGPSPFYWNIGTQSGDSVTFTGCTVDGAGSIATIGAHATFTNHKFNNCSIVDLSDAPTVNSMTVTNTTGSYAVDIGSRTSVDNIDLTAVASEYALYWTPSNGDTLTLGDGMSFTGYATGKTIYADLATGTVTVLGGGIVSTDITSAGCTVLTPTVTTWDITDSAAPDGARYEIVGSTTGTIDNDVVSGGSGISVTGQVLTSGETVRLRWWLDNEAASGATANQVKWKNAASTAQSGGGTISFAASDITDWSTYFQTWAIVTPSATLGSDLVNMEVEANVTGTVALDPAHTIKFISKTIGSNSSGAGITAWFPAGGPVINVLSAAEVEIKTALVDMHFVNTGTGNLQLIGVSGLRIFRDDGGTLLDGGGVSPTLHYDTGKTYVAVTSSGLSAGESAKLTAIDTAVAANLDAPVSTVDTVVDAIKAKTDNLPSSPAAQTKLDEVHQRLHLDASNPVTETKTSSTFGGITITRVTTNPGEETQQTVSTRTGP